MNIFNKALLNLVLLPSGLYRKLGIDLPKLRTIVSIKLLMDDRRPNSFQQTRRKKEKQISLATVGTMILSFLLGFIYLYAFAIGKNMITHLTIYFSMFFFMLSATLISDFTSVLIDVRDTFIILPKPVNDSTMVAARLLHIFIHLCKIVLPMCIPGVIMMVSRHGIPAAIFLFIIILFITLFVLFFINALYILILRITTPQKFQNIISYIQIIFAIVIYASYQIVPRMMDGSRMSGFDISSKPFILIYPIYWFASLWQILMNFKGDQSLWLSATLGLLIPFLSIWLVVKYMAPSFNNKLAMITSTSDTVKISAPSNHHRKKWSYSEWLSRIITKGFGERMGFLFTWKMTARSRDFKMKVYPSIGYLLVYLVIVFWNKRQISIEDISSQSDRGKVLVISCLYFTSFLLTMSLNQMIYSEKYKAAWIFYVSPLRRPGEVILGAAKAAIMKFYIPLVVCIMAIGIFFSGLQILPNLVLGLFNQLLIAFVLVYSGNKAFPFSLHQNTNVKAGSFLRSMGILFFSGLIAVGHYFIYNFTPALLLCSIISLLALWYIIGSIRNTNWQAIKSAYEE